MPRRNEGDAFIEFHADTSEVQPEAERGIRQAAENIEQKELKDIGHDFGETISKSMGDEFEKQGPELARSVERGLSRQRVRTKVRVEFDRDNNIIKRSIERIVDDVEDAFDQAAGPGGPFDRIGRGLADAIGAGFNVSGRSSLIAFLIPLVGVIVALVTAALQAVNGLIAALATLPALIAGIGIQVGTLAIVFQGIGTAIEGAFAAKNAKELKEALKELAPAAQQFVRELLPLRDMFREIQRISQQAFFANLGSVIPQLQKALGPAFTNGFINLAAALGSLFRDLALFFASPTFVEFVTKLFPATEKWLSGFGPNFIKFLDGLTKLSIILLPFLNTLGMMLSGTLFQLGDFFSRMSESPKSQEWLDSMQATLESVLELFGQLIGFVTTFLTQLDEAGGKQVIDELVEAIALLTFFLSSPVGQKAMEGLIRFAMISIDVFTGLLIIVFSLFAIFETISEWITGTAIPATVNWFKMLLEGVLWLFDKVGGALMWFFNLVGGAVIAGYEAIKKFVVDLWNNIKEKMGEVVTEARTLPGKIVTALGNTLLTLYKSGRDLIAGFISGIKSKASELVEAVQGLLGQAMKFFPGSPAEEGPLSGKGYSLYRGQRMMEDFARGIRMEIPTVQAASNEATSNINFGPGAIRVSFEGALPTQQQAEQTGTAVGAGINGQLAARNTRLAVRTL